MSFTITFSSYPFIVLHHDVQDIGNLVVDRVLDGGLLVTVDEETYYCDPELQVALQRGWGSWYVDIRYFNGAYGMYIVSELGCHCRAFF